MSVALDVGGGYARRTSGASSPYWEGSLPTTITAVPSRNLVVRIASAVSNISVAET